MTDTEKHEDRIAELERQLHDAIFGQPAEMSYCGRLIPINSTGLREMIDEASKFRAIVAALAKSEPEVSESNLSCFHCGAWENHPHDVNCLWCQAREATQP